MIPAERYYRQQALIESLERIAVDVALLSPGTSDGSLEFTCLTHARMMIHHAVGALHDARRESRAQCEPALLEAQLKASIELLHQSPERMRAEENGELA